jgi:hypothetical protein
MTKYVFVNSEGGVVQSVVADDDCEVIDLDWDEVKQRDDTQAAIRYCVGIIERLNRVPEQSAVYGVAQEAVKGIRERLNGHIDDL